MVTFVIVVRAVREPSIMKEISIAPTQVSIAQQYKRGTKSVARCPEYWMYRALEEQLPGWLARRDNFASAWRK
jgi:hypothetical protein